jgi:hypothetical protein
MGETRILIRFLGFIFHGTGNSARLCQNFGIISGGGLSPSKHPPPPSGYASGLRVTKNMVLRVMFESWMEELAGGLSKPFIEEINNLYSSLGIVRVIRQRRISWVGHVAHKGENACRVLVK